MNQVKKVVAWLYLNKSSFLTVLAESSEEAAEIADALFQNVPIFLRLQILHKEFPSLRCMVEMWESELKFSQNILAIVTSFGKATTCIEVSIQKVKVRTIFDTGLPVNVVSSKLVRRLKMAPDLN